MISGTNSQSKNILIIILFLICNISQAQHTKADFNSLNIETGLSHNSVLSVAQDKKGYLWFASMDGLNRFDGYNIKIYNHIPGDSSSLSGNELNTLFVDDKGRLWIGTVNGGLGLYDDVHDNFINFLHNDSIPSSISSNAVWSVAQDSSGNLWIGTENGLNRMSKHKLSAKNISSIDCKFTSFKSNPGDSNSLSNSLVWSVLFDKSNNGWVGTDRGLNRFSARQVNSDTIQFEHFFNGEKDPGSIAIDNVWQLYMDRSDNLWVCSYNGMLDMIYANSLNGTPEISHLLPQIQSVTGIKKMGILNILQDNEFNYWAGTNSFGLINFSLAPADSGQYNIRLISYYVNNLSDNKSLSNNTVYQVFQDTSHVFWIATADGISIYHPEKQKFNNTSLLPDFSVIDGKPVSAVYSDKNKNIVVGTLSEGLYALPSAVKLKSSDSAPHFLKDKAIQSFSVDSENNFWMGTDQGIFFLMKDEYDKFVSNNLLHPPVFKSFNKKNTPQLFTEVILSLKADHFGNIWIGTGGGINVWNYKKKIFERILNEPNPAQVSGASIIRCLYTLKSGIVLAGTDKGIFQFDPSVYPFTEKK
ncbi:MAG: two-component regulator propeller domain-containing protein, partial [Bacteroidota bacterium]